MSSTRIIVRGATTAVTRRTNLRKAFLAPWHSLVEQCWLYALADAQREHRFLFHHGVRVVSHHHLSLTPRQADLGEILRRLHHDVSCALNTLLAHERYDAPRNIFDGRQPHVMRLLDAAAQASHLTYEYLNPVAAGLIARPEHMPGTVLDWGHWKGGPIVVRRPDVYFGADRPEQLELALTPPPLLMHAFQKRERSGIPRKSVSSAKSVPRNPQRERTRDDFEVRERATWQSRGWRRRRRSPATPPFPARK